MFAHIRLACLTTLCVWLISVHSRPILPVDETRYLSVAWEMWTNDSFLVPILNGEPYAHKPPLLFWLIHAGWFVFGINDWTARAIPLFFSLLNYLLVVALARELWPEKPGVAAMAAPVLGGGIVWILLSTVIMFDIMLAFWTQLGLLGVLAASRENKVGWLLLTAAIAGGILSKGPVIFVHLLPVAILRRWWNPGASFHLSWYFALAGTTVAGLVLALVWAIPAAISGGPDFGAALFWHQTANRLVSSFAHQRPIWWYVAVLPTISLPWVFWKPAWRSLRIKNSDAGLRFCIIWLVSALLIFSLISGKQIHYLIPEFPALALFLARSFEDRAGRSELPPGFYLFGMILGIFGIALNIVAASNLQIEAVPLMRGRLAAVGVIGLVAAVLCFTKRFHTYQGAVNGVAILTCAIALSIHIPTPQFWKRYDIREASKRIHDLQRQGTTVAHISRYHGQFHYLGRLSQPIRVLHKDFDHAAYAAHEPDGIIVAYADSNVSLDPNSYVFEQIYRGKRMIFWKTSAYRPEE